MRIEANEPLPGKLFLATFRGQHAANRGLLMLGLMLGALAAVLAVLGSPQLPGWPEEPRELVQAAWLVATLLSATGFAVLVGVTTFQTREYTLFVTGETDGSISTEGSSERDRQRFAADLAPWSLAVVRRLAEDISPRSLDSAQLALYASAQDDTRVDELAPHLIRTEVALIDRNGASHRLLLARELLPEGLEAAFEKLRNRTHGHLDRLRGGGFVLKLPDPRRGR